MFITSMLTERIGQREVRVPVIIDPNHYNFQEKG